jgi:hypothetical protein
MVPLLHAIVYRWFAAGDRGYSYTKWFVRNLPS